MQGDRRRSKRARVQGAAVVHAGSVQLACELVDVGVGGMAVLADEPAPRGFVRINFRVHDQACLFDVPGVVVREEERGDRSLWGVQFHGLDTGTRTKLRNFVKSNHPSSADSSTRD